MARRRYVRKSIGKADGGSAWISYSDMMAALLLVFVLVLCYSMYQYFTMLETKTIELDEQASLLSIQQSTLDEQQATLSSQRSILRAQEDDLATKEAALTEKQNELDGALTTLTEQQGLLDIQTSTLEEQEKLIITARTELSLKETELATAKTDLEGKQKELADATILLGTQQEAMATQQQRLDDLVGVRMSIIRELSSAFSSADLKASVDKNTGDIMLESAVFFDVGKSNIKDSGKQLLNEFIPVYLGVLLRPEYADYLGEIIIEGHTDITGTYLSNLELSQDRALTVATYCLQMNSLTTDQLSMLRSILTANGRSSTDAIYNDDGSINMDASRRVQFKFRLKDAEMIDQIRDILGSEE
ncbi:MAG: OmpA family protein [Clostridiales bacterium]|nr:OmpA family protein [Clostridiales bacterium]